jgi:hypothetical protein
MEENCQKNAATRRSDIVRTLHRPIRRWERVEKARFWQRLLANRNPQQDNKGGSKMQSS